MHANAQDVGARVVHGCKDLGKLPSPGVPSKSWKEAATIAPASCTIDAEDPSREISTSTPPAKDAKRTHEGADSRRPGRPRHPRPTCGWSPKPAAERNPRQPAGHAHQVFLHVQGGLKCAPTGRDGKVSALHSMSARPALDLPAQNIASPLTGTMTPDYVPRLAFLAAFPMVTSPGTRVKVGRRWVR